MSWATSSKCLVIAHRGDTQEAPENTLPAFEAALALGVDGIELDLQLTRDGHVVVFHDDTCLRLAGRPEAVRDLTLPELRSLRISGEVIPTLEEVLDLVIDRLFLNLELKTNYFFSSSLEKATLRLLKSFGLKDSILISSFFPQSLWKMKRLAPDLARGYLFEKYFRLHQCLIPWVRPLSINAPLAAADAGFIQAEHDAGRRVFIWTVNAEDDMKRLMKAGADGLITDEPRRLLSLRS